MQLALLAIVFMLLACENPTDGKFSGAIRGYNNQTAAIAAPRNVIAKEENDGSIVITWDAVADADGYNIYRKKRDSADSVRGGTSKTQFADKGKSVAPDTPYYYSVSAYKGERESGKSAAKPNVIELSAADPNILAAPDITDARVNAGTNSIVLTWTAVDGATGYRIYRSSNFDDKQYIFKHESTAVTYTDSNLAAGLYTYQVSAVNDTKGEGYLSVSSDPAEIPPEPNTLPPPPAVLNLRARTESAAIVTITLTWQAAAAATKYYVLRSEDGETYTQIGFADGITNYENKSNAAQFPVEWGKKYYYRVKSYTGNQEGYLSAACGPVVVTPAKPVISGATGSARNETVRWTITGAADGFRVYRSADNKQFELLKTVDGDVFNYLDTIVTVGTWHYRIIAYNSGGESPHSDSFRVEVPSTGAGGTPIDIKLGSMDEAVLFQQTATASANTDTVFTVTGTYSLYQWYIDGTAVSGAAGTSATVALALPGNLWKRAGNSITWLST